MDAILFTKESESDEWDKLLEDPIYSELLQST